MSDSAPTPTAAPLRAPVFALVLVLIACGLWLAFGVTAINTDVPLSEYGEQPNTRAVFRIFFTHVPAAFATYASLALVFIGSIGYLFTRNERFDRIHLAALEVSLIFATFVLASGMIWAGNIWGTPWNWEPRLVSMLVLWFLIVSALALRSAVGASGGDLAKQRLFAAVFGVVVCVGAPFVHYATTWFVTQHHPDAGSATSGQTGYGERAGTLMLGVGTALLLAVALVALRVAHERVMREIARLQRQVIGLREKS